MRRVTPLLAGLLLVAVGLGSVGRSWARFHRHVETLSGVVTSIDVVGKGVEVESPSADGLSHRRWFLLGDGTEIRSRGRAAAIGDLRRGEEVTITFFPARLPRTAERVEVD